MLSYDVCDELTVCRVNRVTSWSCDELTGSQRGNDVVGLLERDRRRLGILISVWVDPRTITPQFTRCHTRIPAFYPQPNSVNNNNVRLLNC